VRAGKTRGRHRSTATSRLDEYLDYGAGGILRQGAAQKIEARESGRPGKNFQGKRIGTVNISRRMGPKKWPNPTIAKAGMQLRIPPEVPCWGQGEHSHGSKQGGGKDKWGRGRKATLKDGICGGGSDAPSLAGKSLVRVCGNPLEEMGQKAMAGPKKEEVSGWKVARVGVGSVGASIGSRAGGGREPAQ